MQLLKKKRKTENKLASLALLSEKRTGKRTDDGRLRVYSLLLLSLNSFSTEGLLRWKQKRASQLSGTGVEMSALQELQSVQPSKVCECILRVAVAWLLVSTQYGRSQRKGRNYFFLKIVCIEGIQLDDLIYIYHEIIKSQVD